MAHATMRHQSHDMRKVVRLFANRGRVRHQLFHLQTKRGVAVLADTKNDIPLGDDAFNLSLTTGDHRGANVSLAQFARDLLHHLVRMYCVNLAPLISQDLGNQHDLGHLLVIFGSRMTQHLAAGHFILTQTAGFHEPRQNLDICDCSPSRINVSLKFEIFSSRLPAGGRLNCDEGRR